MRADLQQQISPFQVQNTLDLSAAKVQTEEKARDSNSEKPVDFGALLQNSNDDVKKEREAKANGDFSGAKTNEEFVDQLSDATKIKPTNKNNLDKDDFLKLFVTQLQNQDPMNPDDGAEMASKLAQFNSVEQMMNANKKLEDLVKNQSTFMDQQLVHYLGKEVTIDGGKIKLDEGNKTPSLEFDAASDANQAKIEIRDQSGAVVGELDVGVIKKGQNTVPWTPVNQKGEPLHGGLYSYTVSGQNDGGEAVPVKITTQTRVTGVDLKDGKSIKSDLGDLKFTDVVSLGLNTPKATKVTAPAPQAPSITPAKDEKESTTTPPSENVPSLVEAAGLTPNPAPQTENVETSPSDATRQGATGEAPTVEAPVPTEPVNEMALSTPMPPARAL
ncbi:MAG: flagellar hook capping FlgD N-terminal domain-containing protein [Oligoflexales bacterium]